MDKGLENIGNNTQPTPEEVQAWKQKNGRLLLIKVEAYNEKEEIVMYEFYFKTRYPNKRAVIEMATKAAAEKNIRKFNEILIFNALVNGENILREDDEVFQALTPFSEKLMTTATASLGN